MGIERETSLWAYHEQEIQLNACGARNGDKELNALDLYNILCR